MKLPSVNLPKTKTLIHSLQGFIIFLGWALTIAVFTKDGPMDGRSAWYFALCWFSIPALIYLAAVPLWPRTRRFGNPYAFAAVDILFALLWFTAWVAVATYVGTGKDAENDDGKTGCDAFAYGSPGKCTLSTGTVVLGVFVFLLFVLTSYMSYRAVMEYRRTGMMPYDGTDPTFAAQSKAAFSSNIAHDFDEEEGGAGGVGGAGDREGRGFRSDRFADQQPSQRDEDDYALLQQNELEDTTHPSGGRPMQPYDPTMPSGRAEQPILPMPDVHHPDALMHDYDTSYGGAYGSHRPHPSNDYSMGSGYGR